MKAAKSVQRLRFETDVLPHVDALWRTALWLTMRRSKAEDLVLNSISKAYRLGSNSADTIDNKAGLFRILVREFSDGGYRQQHGHRFLHENGKSVASWNNVNEQEQFKSIHRRKLSLLTNVSGMHVKAAIARLRPQSRLIMLLLFRERFSYADIAYITDLREESVKSILDRLRRLIPRYILLHAQNPAAWAAGRNALKARLDLPREVEPPVSSQSLDMILRKFTADIAACNWENEGGALDRQ